MISVSIYRSELVKHNACAEGLALFDRVLAQCGPKSRALGRVYIREWMPLHTVWLYAVCGSFACWAERRGCIPRAYLRGADLEGAYLEDADLEGAYLEGAYLTGAYLTCAYLRGAYLRGAYLRGADLRGADLAGAYLEGAYLEGANLEGAYLEGANLEGANLEGANLEGAYRGESSAPIPCWRTLATGFLERGGAS